MIEEAVLKPCDIFLTRGTGTLSRIIRFFTRSFGESRTMVNHVGLVVEEGTISTAVILEARSREIRSTLLKAYGSRDDSVAVYRPLNLTEEEKRKIVSTAKTLEGNDYGYLKLIAHFLDWCFLGIYLFRRFANDPYYPICSYLVSRSFSKAGKNFGVQAGKASPDDIWDYIQLHSDNYSEVLSLSHIFSHIRHNSNLT